jgi:hypothetical protein
MPKKWGIYFDEKSDWPGYGRPIFRKNYFTGHLGHWIYCHVLHKSLLWRVWGRYMSGFEMSHFVPHRVTFLSELRFIGFNDYKMYFNKF